MLNNIDFQVGDLDLPASRECRRGAIADGAAQRVKLVDLHVVLTVRTPHRRGDQLEEQARPLDRGAFHGHRPRELQGLGVGPAQRAHPERDHARDGLAWCVGAGDRPLDRLDHGGQQRQLMHGTSVAGLKALPGWGEAA